MADQARWFKLWCSAPDDDALQALPPALRWAWAAFGAYTKLHGTAGVIQVRPTNAVLAAQLGVPAPELLTTLGCLPSIYLGTAPVRWPHGHEKQPVCAGEFMRGSYPLEARGTRYLEEWGTRHGEVVVTWRNWVKYQEDTTQAQRGAASRIKRRREEMRRDEMRRDVETPPISPPKGDMQTIGLKGFLEFYAAYPKHEGREAALKKWTQLKPDQVLLDRMLAAITAQKRSRKWQEDIIPMPATWLNQRRWEDEVAPALPFDAKTASTVQAANRVIERLKGEQP